MKPQVTPEELARVSAYWEWVKAIGCEHTTLTFSIDQPVCSDCKRPVKILSDLQLEEMRRPTPDTPTTTKETDHA